MTKRVFVTGANGFLGRHCVEALSSSFEVYAACYGRIDCRIEGVRYLDFDITDAAAVERAFGEIGPSHLLHLAWYVEPSDYMRSVKNLDWLEYSLYMMRAFIRNGGTRLVTAGTCAEYDWMNAADDGVFDEDSPIATTGSLYSAAKNSINILASSFMSSEGLSHSHGRVFFLFGPGENESRLVRGAMSAFEKGMSFTVENGGLVRDYLYVKDVASAFASILGSDIQGAVNIGSGEGCALLELLERLERSLGVSGLLECAAPIDSGGLAPRIIARNEKLKSTGWRVRYPLRDAFEDYIRERRERYCAE